MEIRLSNAEPDDSGPRVVARAARIGAEGSICQPL